MKRAFFITGTDTEVGKTHTAASLLHTARLAGLTAVAMKPVAAGTDEHGENDDVLRLRAAANVDAPVEWVNPYCFRAAIAPHIAAAQEGREIDFDHIVHALARLSTVADCILVEGAGGFRVPLGPQGDSADLARRLELPVILVVGLRLGCINHALLTAEAIRARGLTLAGWVANQIDPAMPCQEENLAALQAGLAAPLLGVIPYGKTPAEAGALLTLPAAP
jgi:dethiobiotin synthetase